MYLCVCVCSWQVTYDRFGVQPVTSGGTFAPTQDAFGPPFTRYGPCDAVYGVRACVRLWMDVCYVCLRDVMRLEAMGCNKIVGI